MTRPLLFVGVYLSALDFWKLPYRIFVVGSTGRDPRSGRAILRYEGGASRSAISVFKCAKMSMNTYIYIYIHIYICVFM